MEHKISFKLSSSDIELSEIEQNIIFAVTSIVGSSGRVLRYTKNFENKTLEIDVKLTGSNATAIQKAFNCLNNFKSMSGVSNGSISSTSSNDWSDYSCGGPPAHRSSSCGYDSCGTSSSNNRC